MAKIKTIPEIDRFSFDYKVFKLSVRRSVSPKQLKCFEALERLGPSSSNEISELLIMPRNTITARLSELKAMGFITKNPVENGKKFIWKIKYPF